MSVSGAGYAGTLYDVFTYHNGKQFSTYDADHDTWGSGNCALDRNAGWWYGACGGMSLNGVYTGTGSLALRTYEPPANNFKYFKTVVIMIRRM
jgi:hypothetical protein